MRTRAFVLASSIALLLSAACGSQAPPSGSKALNDSLCTAGSIEVLPGDPTCADVGPGLTGFRVEPVLPGYNTYNVNGGTITLGSPSLVYFNWYSTFGIDAVIAKGGPNADVYVYDPAALQGLGLRAPMNPDTCYPYSLQAVTFCYQPPVPSLQMSKTAAASFDRQYRWGVGKQASVSDIVLAGGEIYNATFDVTATLGGYTDSSFAASGNLYIHNPAAVDATITGVTDSLDDGTGVAVDCHVSFPFTLAAGGDLTCDYSISLPDATARINYATVTTTGPVGGVSASANVDFGTAAIAVIDGCASVSDDHGGTLGHVCYGDSPKTFSYQAAIGPFACGASDLRGSVTNTATIVTDDTGTQGQASWTINYRVPACMVGCTLTPGYWKTHSDRGPAPYDDAWKLVGALEESTPFFLSGKTWYEAFWTSPAGNAYWILAHAYEAAAINGLNGASVPASVATAMSSAQALFQSHTPGQIAGLKGSSPLRAQFIALASLLDAYNNGTIGPGHCSE